MRPSPLRLRGAAIVAAVAVLLPAGVLRPATAAGTKAHAAAHPPPFPYWPAGAGPQQTTHLADGAAFRKAIRQITTRARKAGWTKVSWGQLKDGGSVDMTFARPEPDLRRVRVFLKWHMARGDADLSYAVDRREPATRVHGFPLCAGPLSTGAVMTGRGDARNVSAAYCDGGGYATGIATRPDAFPRLYGWKPVGEVQGRVVYKRRGRFVEASSKLDGTLGRVLNVVRFDGRHDPRGRH